MIEKFCEHFDVISGYAFKSADLKDDGDIPVIKIGNISSGANVVEDSNTQYVSKDFLKINEKYHIKKDDILISLTGSHINQPNSMVGRVCRNYRDRIYLLNQRAGKVIPKQIESRDYIFYLLSSKCIKEDIANRAYGAANQVNISSSAIGNIKWDFPSIDMQKKIGDVLSSFDNLIEINNKRIKMLEKMAENLYKEWFVRFRFPGYETAEFVDGVPKGWDVYRLDEICEINKHSLKKSDKIDKIQYLDTGSLTENSITNLETCFRSDAPSRAKRKVKENSILFSTVRPALKHYGILKKVPENMIVSTGFVVLDSKYDIANIIYMHLTSEVVLSYCQMIAEGAVATYPTIKPEEIGKIKIVLPPIETAVEWNEKLEVYFSMQLKLIEQNQNLIKQRDYLLPRLMSGKLQVK